MKLRRPRDDEPASAAAPPAPGDTLTGGLVDELRDLARRLDGIADDLAEVHGIAPAPGNDEADEQPDA